MCTKVKMESLWWPRVNMIVVYIRNDCVKVEIPNVIP